MSETEMNDNLASRRGLLPSATLTPLTVLPTVAATEDAELIDLCGRVVDNQATTGSLNFGRDAPDDPGRDPVVGPQLRSLHAEFRRLVGLLDDHRPTTLGGARAMSRAALSRCPRDMEGDPSMDDGADQMLVKIAQWLAGAEFETWQKMPAALRDGPAPA